MQDQPEQAVPTVQVPTENTFTVHVYREMRLVFSDVKADTPEAAAKIAFNLPTVAATSCDDCEGRTFAALVDTVGDDEYDKSETFKAPDGAMLDLALELLALAQRLEEQFGAALDANSDINGADAVDFISEFIPMVRAATAKAIGAA